MSRFVDRTQPRSIITPRHFQRIARPRGSIRFAPGFIYAGASAGSLAASYIGENHEGAVSASSYSFASQNIGVAAADRYVFLNIQWFSTANTPVLNSCSIGGLGLHHRAAIDVDQ